MIKAKLEIEMGGPYIQLEKVNTRRVDILQKCLGLADAHV
jgi:hypothetical protein